MSTAKHKIGRSKTEPLHPSGAPFNLGRVSSAPAAFGDRARANARIKETAVKKKDKVYEDDRAKREENLNRIIGNFAAINQRFNELDYAASVSGSAASVVSGPDTQGFPPPFGRESSQNLGDDSPGPPVWDDNQGVAGLPPLPSAPTRGESIGSFGSAGSDASTASSVYESVIQDARDLLSPENQRALSKASVAAAAAVDAGANNMTREQQIEVLGREGNQGLLDNIDAEFDALMNDIINSSAVSTLVSITGKVYKLVELIMTAIGRGLGFAIKYPKLAILIIGLGYLQYPLFARIVNFTVGSVWTILQYLFGMTTAGQKIGQFINGIMRVYTWCSENGVATFEQFMAKLNYLVGLAENIQENMDALKAIADKLGVDLADLIQIIISMRDTFSSPTPGAGHALWNMLGQFASGAGSGAAQALLGNGAGAAGFPRLQPGGGKRKTKSKTNKKRKSKSNKKGKTKTRRR
jgi:hypothetical protein